jgi:hypothetical protein
MKLIVSAEAASDLARLQAFRAEKSPSAARRARTVLAEAIQSLETFPSVDDRRKCGTRANSWFRLVIQPMWRRVWLFAF